MLLFAFAYTAQPSRMIRETGSRTVPSMWKNLYQARAVHKVYRRHVTAAQPGKLNFWRVGGVLVRRPGRS